MTSLAADTAAPGFPGFSEDMPLDLANLSAAAEAGIVGRLLDKSHAAWAETAGGVGYCAHPIRLTGSSATIDRATGEVVASFASTESPLGVLYRACGNRRADICPACSRTYARDTFAMIKSGVAGGKTIPETVANNPLLFVTLTAPSFGHVHSPRSKNGQPVGGRCRPRDRVKVCDHGRPIGCMAVHDQDDSLVGAPLCPDCYDWDSAVVWQWWAPELWRRTTIALKRAVAAELEVPEHRLQRVASVQFAKVAEYQARGLIHFHALIRLDGPDGPGSPAPLTGDRLAVLVDRAARSVTYTAPGVDYQDRGRVLAWGQQLDIRVVRDRARADTLDGSLTAEQVAGYLAKYATKDAANLRADDHRLLPHSDRIARTCRLLAERARKDDLAGSPYRLLSKWAHMLGFPATFPASRGATRSPSDGFAGLGTGIASWQPKRVVAVGRSMFVILKRGCWPTMRKPHWWSGAGDSRASAGPALATKRWRWLLPLGRGSTSNGRPSNAEGNPVYRTPASPDNQPSLCLWAWLSRVSAANPKDTKCP